MARAIWTGALSFGLVNIPVEVHTAVRDHRPRFRMLHAKDRSPINFERVCQKEGEPVKWADLVKGYEYEKGRYVVLTREDLKTAALEKTRRIGIAKFLLRDVQHLAAVEVIEHALVLSLLRFADELVDTSSLAFPARTPVKKKELELATTLVENLAAEWEPEKYTDDFRENVMRVIKAKIKGRKADLVVDEPVRDSNVVDLMEKLRRSLEGAGGKARQARASTTKRAATTRSRKRPTSRRAA